MGIHARVIVAVLVLFGSVAVDTLPAHADADNVDNHLCLNTGFGYYGVSGHVHITPTGGAYHISTFGQASAWTYTGSGQYCYQNSATLGCPAYVYEVVYQNGGYLGTTIVYQNSGVHSVSTGNHSYGSSAANYIVEAYVGAYFDNACSSEADGAVSTYLYN